MSLSQRERRWNIRALCKYLKLPCTRRTCASPCSAARPPHEPWWLFKEVENVLAASLWALSTGSPQRTHRRCQASSSSNNAPRKGLISLDCVCSFGSVIPLSAVRSKKAFSLPGAPRGDLCAVHPLWSPSPWVTVPPLGEQPDLQSHSPPRLSSCQLLIPGWSQESVCPVLFFLSKGLLLCSSWDMEMKHECGAKERKM